MKNFDLASCEISMIIGQGVPKEVLRESKTVDSVGQVILDGNFLVAAPISLLAGIVSFLSPCVLPLVPGYLGYVSGLAGTQMSQEIMKTTQSQDGQKIKQRYTHQMFVGITLFVLGFTTVFILVSFVINTLFARLGIANDVLVQFLGIPVILLGLIFMGLIPYFQKEQKLQFKPRQGLWGAPLLGAIFGIGWAPCMGPTLAAVQVLSLSGGVNQARGIALTIIYCLGLGIPFIFIALALSKGMRAIRIAQKHRVGIMRFGGVMLIIVGVLMATGVWTMMIGYFQGWLSGIELPI